jgi:hypothetical protein
MAEVELAGGVGESVPVSAAASVFYPLGRGEMPELKFELPLLMKAPVARGAIAGRAVWLLDGNEIGSCPLVFTESVARAPTGLERFLSGVQGFFGARSGS